MASPKTFETNPRAALALLAALLLAPAAAAAETAIAPPGRALESIVAVVNDDIVLASELESEAERIRASLLERGSQVPPDRLLRRQVLERLVVRRLMVQHAANIGISVTDEELDRSIAEIAERNQVTLEQLAINIEKMGMRYADYREDMREEMLVDRVRRQDLERRVTVTPRELDQYIASNPGADDTEYDVSHILISLRGQATPDEVQKNLERAEATYEHLTVKGNDFATTAAAYSDAPDALEGGALGWRRRVQLPAVFAEAVTQLKPGETSKPLRSSAGFHIIKLNGVRQGQPVLVTQYLARHILVKPNQVLSDEQARTKLEGLRAQILGGADFAELAKLNSEDPGTKNEGGDLGWSDPSQFVPAFTKVLTALKKDEISGPFETGFGWHIVQLLDVREQDVTDQVKRNRIGGQLRQRKLEEQGQLWLQRLRDEAYLEIRLKG